MKGYLLVQASGELYGLDLDHILEVRDGFEVFPAPSLHAAVRGVMQWRDRLLPVMHLGALVEDVEPPVEHARTVVIADCGAVVAFEVDDAVAAEYDEPLPVPDRWQFPWASGVVRPGGTLVPVLDVAMLVGRLTPLAVMQDA